MASLLLRSLADRGRVADRERNPQRAAGARGDVLTIGVALAIYFASSGIESLRIGLNRAYGVPESEAGGFCGWNRSATC